MVTVFFFALSDVLTKQLTVVYPVPMVIAVRYAASLAILLFLVLPRMGRRLWHTERTGLVLVRAAVLTMASLTMGFALKLMPVGETIAIMYLSPFAVMLLAIPLLGEKVTPVGWFLAILGFSGVLLILRPGAGLDPVGVLFALANATCATAFHLLTRALSRSESAVSMLFHVTLVGAVFSSLAALPTLSGPPPPFGDAVKMVLLGLFATTGHFLFAAAYREAAASLIAPLNYLHLVWAALLGWVVFGHAPDSVTILGMALIFASGAAIALRSHMSGRRSRSIAKPELAPD